MNYPIDFSFKLLAIASQIYIRDTSGSLLAYVKQKLFKLREDINVFADENQTQHLFNIKQTECWTSRRNITSRTRGAISSARSNAEECVRYLRRATRSMTQATSRS